MSNRAHPPPAGAAARPPRHVAIIMDGNGRWAKQRGLSRLRGHQEGARSVQEVLEEALACGVEYLTLYAFSVENWIRPREEVKGLMLLLQQYLRRNVKELHQREVRFRAIGRLTDLPAGIQREIAKTTRDTAGYTRGNLTLCLSYGGRAELADAARAIARKVRAGEIDPEAVSETLLASHLYAPDLPDPDLMIRTSNEQRISNFLLWQLSYAEFYFTPTLWPDFRAPQFRAALEAYAQRHRRFGDIA
jgi:undecaprenyl diphosphate synthase